MEKKTDDTFEVRSDMQKKAAQEIVEVMKKNKLKHYEVPAVLLSVQSILSKQEIS